MQQGLFLVLYIYIVILFNFFEDLRVKFIYLENKYYKV